MASSPPLRTVWGCTPQPGDVGRQLGIPKASSPGAAAPFSTAVLPVSHRRIKAHCNAAVRSCGFGPLCWAIFGSPSPVPIFTNLCDLLLLRVVYRFECIPWGANPQVALSVHFPLLSIWPHMHNVIYAYPLPNNAAHLCR